MTHDQFGEMAHLATTSLLAQVPVVIGFGQSQRPDGFPLPIKRNKEANDEGVVIQMYRPLAILEYVNDVLSGKIAGDQQRKRLAEKKKEPS
jgi:hypothetical protein